MAPKTVSPDDWPGSDTDKLRAAFDCAENARDSVKVEIDRHYHAEDTVVVGRSAQFSRYDVCGHGYVYWEGTDAVPCIQIGDIANKRKMVWGDWRNFRTEPRGAGYTSGGGGVLLSNVNHTRFTGCSFTGYLYGIASDPAGFQNSLVFDRCDALGGLAAVGADLVHCNNLMWTGGKIQQCTTGMRIARSTGVTVAGVDFSLCSGDALVVERCAASTLHFYSESIGGDHVLRITDGSNAIGVRSAFANGARAGQPMDYPIKLESARGIGFYATSAKHYRRGWLHADEQCGPNYIDPACVGFGGHLLDQSGGIVNASAMVG